MEKWYHCKDCGTNFEVYGTCPSCGSGKVTGGSDDGAQNALDEIASY